MSLMLSGPLLGQRFAFEYFGRAQGLRNLSIRALAQDRDGLLWIGTANGLYQFDGFRFRAFHTADGLPDSNITCLAAAPSGEVVVAASVGLAVVREGRLVPVTLEPKGDRPPPLLTGPGCLAFSPDGVLHAMTAGGLYLGRLPAEGAPRLRRVPGVLAGRSGRSVALDSRRGDIWFSCAGSVCRLTAEGAIEDLGTARGLPAGDWGGLAVDRNGTLWVRDGASAFRLHENGVRFERASVTISQAGTQAGLSVDAAGRLWVPTFGGLYGRSPEGKWTRYGTANGLPADAVHVAFQDRLGVLWLGFEGKGLARWSGFPAYRGYQRLDGLSDDNVTAFTRDAHGRLWIGTRGGLNRMEEGGRFRHWGEADGLPSDVIRALAATPDGALWIAPERGPLYRFDPATGHTRRFGPAEGLSGAPVTSLLADGTGTLWVATRGGLYTGAATAARPRFTPHPLPIELARGAIHRVTAAADGGIWVAGQGGVGRERGGTWRVYGRSSGLRFDNVTQVAEAGGGLWVAYAGPNGISRLDFNRAGEVGRASHFFERGLLSSNSVRFLGGDRRGRLWVGTDAGIDRYDHGRRVPLGLRDGMISEECLPGAFLAEADGGVLVGTTSGFQWIHDSAAAPPRAPLAARVTLLESGGVVLPTVHAVLPAREVEIGFSDPRLSGDARFRYRIFRAGETAAVDPDWHETSLPSVRLLRIAAGTYTVEVGAAEPDGTWSTVTSTAEFTVPAAFHETALFRILIFAITGAAMALIVRWRTRALRQKRRLLEAAVEERTRTLSESRDRIAEQKVEIEALLAEAKQSNRLKDEFLANVSHEIRTPMNSVLGMTGLVLDTELSGEQREYLEAAHDSARSLLQLLNDILDLSKIEAGRLDIERAPLAIGLMMEETIRPLRLAAAAKGLTLRVEVPQPLPERVLGDPVRLRQILTNLISNAVKFTREGEVCLTATATREGASGAWFEFVVRDTGIGIPPEKLQIIFERFRQADGSTTREFGGTGLGLAITRRLVELLDGRMSVSSEPGRGSEFRVSLPLPVVGPPPAPRPVELVAPPGRCLAILVAEDNVISQRLVLRLLGKRGHAVTIANHGREAVELFAAGRFDLVLMDVQMPEMDGLEATVEIRRLDAAAGGSTPVVMLTANAMKGDRERCMAAGASAYLTKPVNEAELLRMIETQVPRRTAASA